MPALRPAGTLVVCLLIAAAASAAASAAPAADPLHTPFVPRRALRDAKGEKVVGLGIGIGLGIAASTFNPW